MSRYPGTPDCSIKGCHRAAFKGYLCKAHRELLPPSERGYAAALAQMEDAHRAASKRNKRHLAMVRRILRESPSATGVAARKDDAA